MWMLTLTVQEQVWPLRPSAQQCLTPSWYSCVRSHTHICLFFPPSRETPEPQVKRSRGREDSPRSRLYHMQPQSHQLDTGPFKGLSCAVRGQLGWCLSPLPLPVAPHPISLWSWALCAIYGDASWTSQCPLVRHDLSKVSGLRGIWVRRWDTSYGRGRVSASGRPTSSCLHQEAMVSPVLVNMALPGLKWS